MLIKILLSILIIATTLLGAFSKLFIGDSELALRVLLVSMVFNVILGIVLWKNPSNITFFVIVIITTFFYQTFLIYGAYKQSQANSTYIQMITDLDKTMRIEEKEAIKKYYNNEAVKTFIKKEENMTDIEYSAFVEEQSNTIYMHGDYYVNNLKDKHPVMRVNFIKEVGIYGVNMVTGEFITQKPINFTEHSNYKKYKFL